MDLQSLTKLFYEVKDKVGADAFLDGARLVSCMKDLAPARSGREEIALTQEGYERAEAELTELARLLAAGKKKLQREAERAENALNAAAVPPEDSALLVDAMLGAFGVSRKSKAGKNGAGAQKPARKRFGTAAILVLAAVAAVAVWKFRDGAGMRFGPDRTEEPSQDPNAAGDAPREDGMAEEPMQDQDAEGDVPQTAYAETETETESIYPQVEPEIVLESVDGTVYGDNVTDLSGYALYEGSARDFTFGYPKALYDDISLDSHLEETVYRFSGQDGSSLVYGSYTSGTRMSTGEWRERFTQMLTEGLSDVQQRSFEDGDEEGHFYLTAKDGGLEVVIFGTVYSKSGLGESMTLKYPAPVDEEDRLRKAYYAECLYCLAEFSDSGEQGVHLRTFDEFCNR